MQAINSWLDYLDRMNINYAHSTHPPAGTALKTAEAEKVPAHEFAKSVVLFNGATYLIAVVPSNESVDLVKLASLIDARHLRLAHEQELAVLFPNCEIGAMPPFGDAFDLPVIVDSNLVDRYIAFTLGTHKDVVRMSFADFRRLAKPMIASVCSRY